VIEVVEYVSAAGISPFANWRTTLDNITRARITTAILRLAEGNFSAAKGVGAGIHELRLHFGPGYRVYFGMDGDTLVILLSGGTKQRQNKDIEAAQAAWKQYKLTKRI
jgi:putative addiction module killer protein